MKNEGPVLEILTRHLSECPEYFLMDPVMVSIMGANRGVVSTVAVVFDLLRIMGRKDFSVDDGKKFELRKDPKYRNRLVVIQVASWLLFHDWFVSLVRSDPKLAGEALSLLSSGLNELSTVVKAELFVTDTDRREELVRYCLSFLGYRPKGETLNQAGDRLISLDSLEQQRIIRKSMEHQKMLERKREEEKKRRLEEEERQRQIRAQMERDDESSKATRE